MISVDIISVSQDFDLASREQVNFAMMRLPNGKIFRAMVTDDIMQAIVALAIGAPVPQTEESVSSQFREGSTPDGSPALVFGGDEVDRVPTASKEDLVVASVEEKLDRGAPSPRQVPVVSPVKARLVSVDQSGNPVMEFPNGVDPNSVVGSIGEGDEDGVRQL